MDALRCMSELPYLLHFLSSHKEDLTLPQINIKLLEEGLVDHSSLLPAFLASKLLQKLTGNQGINLGNYDAELKKYLSGKSPTNNPFSSPHVSSETTFQRLNTADKVKLLKWLTDQTNDKKDELDNLFSEEFGTDRLDETIINAGQDRDNKTYWYFDDLRLYRHKSSQPKSEDWETVALNYDDWQQLIDRFSKSNDDQERELYTYLNDYLFPPIKSLLQNPVALPSLTNEHLLTLSGVSVKVKRNMEEAVKLENPELSKVLSEEPSNTAGVDKKQPPMFLQQRSKLFVFSTQMANRAADNVMTSQSKCFLSAHITDPDTKRFLTANPNIDTTIPAPPSNPVSVTNGPHRPTNPFQRSMSMPIKQENSQYHPRAMIGSGHPGRPDISNQIVPTENLTPEQRQKREHGLASLAKIHQMLLADGGNGPPTMTDFSHINMAQDRQPMFSPHSSQPGPEYMQQNAPMFGPHGAQQHPGMNQGMMMDHKPPPPYPMPVPSPSSQTTTASKPGRKRKNSAQSPAPKSPLSQQLKSPKPFAPSPLTQGHRPGSIGPIGSALQPGMPQSNMLQPNMPPQSMPQSDFMRPSGHPNQFSHPQFVSEPSLYHSAHMEPLTAPASHVHQYSSGEVEERTIVLQKNTSVSRHAEINVENSCRVSKMPSSVSEVIKVTSPFAKENNIPNPKKSTASNPPFSNNSMPNPAANQPNLNGPNVSSNGPTASQAPSVNNTYVNAHISIGQINIPNGNASQNGTGGATISQDVNINMSNYNQMGGTPGAPGPQPHNMPHPSQPTGHPTAGHPAPRAGPVPQYPANAPSVRIQNKGPNTIQYLPVSQSQATPALPPCHEPIIPPKRSEFVDPHFPSPIYHPQSGPRGQPFYSSHPSAHQVYTSSAAYESLPRHASPPQYMTQGYGMPGYSIRGPTPGALPDGMYDSVMHAAGPRPSYMTPSDLHAPPAGYPVGYPPQEYMSPHPPRPMPPHMHAGSYPSHPW